MSASVLLATLLAALAPCQQQQPEPMEGDELYTSIDRGGITFRFLANEMTSDEAKTIVQNFLDVRETFQSALAIDPGPMPVITARIRSGSPRYYHTNGEDQIFLDYPSAGRFRPVMAGDQRIEEMGRFLFLQLWLHPCLSSTAGLHPRFMDSVLDYLDYRVRLGEDADAAPPTGAGDVWYKLDSIYGDGIASFVLNNLSGQSLPAHRVVEFLASVAVDVTEDELARELFIGLGALDPVFADEEFEPSERLSPDSPVRLSRLALANGVRLMDLDAEPLSRAEKFRDFDVAYSMVTRSYPDKGLQGTDRSINGVDVWRAYSEFRGRVEQSRDNLDFYLVMREFMSRFGDRWVSVSSPHGAPSWKGVRGLRLAHTDDRLLVASVTEESDAAKAGIVPGMELVEIDGRPVERAFGSLQQYFHLYGSCSSDVEVDARALNVLLTGANDSVARLVLRSNAEDGPQDLTVELTRGAPNAPSAGAAEVKMVETELREDGIGVITVRAFVGPAAAQFSVALDALLGQDAKGVIIDLRGNEAGEPLNALASIGRLLDRKVSLGALQNRDMELPMGNVVDTPITMNPLPNLKPYLGPAAVLTDSWTAGAAELFAMGFLLASRGDVVGSTTAGALNQPLPTQPWQTMTASGVTITLTRNSVVDRSGTPLQGKGIQPTIPVSDSVADIAAGRDGILETAAARLAQ